MRVVAQRQGRGGCAGREKPNIDLVIINRIARQVIHGRQPAGPGHGGHLVEGIFYVRGRKAGRGIVIRDFIGRAASPAGAGEQAARPQVTAGEQEGEKYRQKGPSHWSILTCAAPVVPVYLARYQYWLGFGALVSMVSIFEVYVLMSRQTGGVLPRYAR